MRTHKHRKVKLDYRPWWRIGRDVTMVLYCAFSEQFSETDVNDYDYFRERRCDMDYIMEQLWAMSEGLA